MRVSWVVEIGNEFEPELDELHEDVRTEILALTRLLQQFGPQLGRPRVDTLNCSRPAKRQMSVSTPIWPGPRRKGNDHAHERG